VQQKVRDRPEGVVRMVLLTYSHATMVLSSCLQNFELLV
jgi:hypothetical protein